MRIFNVAVACVGSGIHSAVDGKVRPGYVRGLRTGDKRDQRGDLTHVPIAAKRCECFLWYRPLARGGIRIRIDRARLHVVDCDAPARHFSRQALSEHLDRSLCSRVGHEAGRQGAFAHGRADRDNATTTLHVLQRRLRRDKYAADVDGNQAVQLLQRGLLEPLGNGRASIVHKDVEPAESRHGLFDRGFDGVGISGVRLNCDRLSASAFNLLDDRRGRIGTFRVCDGHVRSVRSQTLGDCSTNAARAARFANLQDFLPQATRSLLALDLGCGTGAIAVRLARLGLHVTLLDTSLPMLDFAKRAAREAGVSERIALKHGDAAHLANLFHVGSFDVILCHNILEYVDDPCAVLRSAARTLRDPSSVLSVLVRNQAGEVLRAAIQESDLAASEHNLTAEWGHESLYGGRVRLFTAESLQAMLLESSLAETAERGTNHIGLLAA